MISYITVTALCAVKYMVGIASGLATDLSFVELFLCYFTGGSIGMVLYTLFGSQIRRWWNKKKNQGITETRNDSNTKKDWKQKIWDKFGLVGIAFITPPILSQPIGTALSLGFGAPAHKVIIAMCISTFFWSLVFAYSGNTIIQYF